MPEMRKGMHGLCRYAPVALSNVPGHELWLGWRGEEMSPAHLHVQQGTCL